MSTIAGGVIQALSVSQVEQYDAQQTGGCPRRWYFERVEGHRPEQSTAMTDGDVGHELLALHLTGQELPRRARMLKAVRGAIAAGHLPAPGPDLIIEQRFDGQPKRDAAGKWVPLRHDTTLHFAGLPWDGFVDAQWRRSDTVDILDHKFSSDIDLYAKPADGLLRTVQMPVYAANALRRWPDAERFRFTHHYVSRRGVKSFVRAQVVTLAQVRERLTDVERVVTEMQSVARAKSQDDVPFNRRACAAYTGCPHQSRCTAFRRNQIAMTAEELALFGGDPAPSNSAVPSDGLDDLFGPPSTPAPPVREEPATSPEPATGYTVVSQTDVTTEEIPLIPLPVASKPAVQPAPVCECGAELNTGNALKLRDGSWTHTNGCPLQAPAPVAEQPAPKRRGRPPKVKPEETPPAEQGQPVTVSVSMPSTPLADAALRSMSADELRDLADAAEKRGDNAAAEELFALCAVARKREQEAREAAEAAPAPARMKGGVGVVASARSPFAEAGIEPQQRGGPSTPDLASASSPGRLNAAPLPCGTCGGDEETNHQRFCEAEYVAVTGKQPPALSPEPTRLRGAPPVAKATEAQTREAERAAWARVTAPAHPLAGTLRVELDLSDRFAALVERVLGRLP